jgi:hypothetical protein
MLLRQAGVTGFVRIHGIQGDQAAWFQHFLAGDSDSDGGVPLNPYSTFNVESWLHNQQDNSSTPETNHACLSISGNDTPPEVGHDSQKDHHPSQGQDNNSLFPEADDISPGASFNKTTVLTGVDRALQEVPHPSRSQEGNKSFSDADGLSCNVSVNGIPFWVDWASPSGNHISKSQELNKSLPMVTPTAKRALSTDSTSYQMNHPFQEGMATVDAPTAQVTYSTRTESPVPSDVIRDFNHTLAEDRQVIKLFFLDPQSIALLLPLGPDAMQLSAPVCCTVWEMYGQVTRITMDMREGPFHSLREPDASYHPDIRAAAKSLFDRVLVLITDICKE